jgi:hypothetical protein
MADPQTEELHVEQILKERREHRRADEAPEPEEAHTHRRRAERAAYLRDKLADRARSEDALGDDEG